MDAPSDPPATGNGIGAQAAAGPAKRPSVPNEPSARDLPETARNWHAAQRHLTHLTQPDPAAIPVSPTGGVPEQDDDAVARPGSPSGSQRQGSDNESTMDGSTGTFGSGSGNSQLGGASDATPPSAAAISGPRSTHQLVQDEAQKRAFHMKFKGCAVDRDSPVNTAAHLVKRSFLRSLSMFDAGSTMDFPAPLEGTAQFLGPYPRELRAKLRAGEFSDEINARSLDPTPGAALLQMSCRNIVLMPKGLEMSMDAGEWVLEPLLPRDVAPIAAPDAGAEQPEVWSPTMWRVKVLSGGDTEVDLTRCAGDIEQHIRVKAALYGFEHGYICGPYLVPLSECAGIRFDFDWSRVSVRALVYTYLYTLAQQSCAGTEVPDPAPLTAGVTRIGEWLAAVKTLGEELSAKKKGSPPGALEVDLEDDRRHEACRAPSVARVEGWFDSLACPSDGDVERGEKMQTVG